MDYQQGLQILDAAVSKINTNRESHAALQQALLAVEAQCQSDKKSPKPDGKEVADRVKRLKATKKKK